MPVKEACLERVVGEVEELAAKVGLLKTRFAKQKASVKLQYYWELEYLRNRFAEFKRRVAELEEAGDERLEAAEQATELAWKDVQHAIESLLALLP